jgi:hypothetical protein
LLVRECVAILPAALCGLSDVVASGEVRDNHGVDHLVYGHQLKHSDTDINQLVFDTFPFTYWRVIEH